MPGSGWAARSGKMPISTPFPEKRMTRKLNPFSSRITEPKSQGASQAMLYGTGLKRDDLAKAEIGIASVWWRAIPATCT